MPTSWTYPSTVFQFAEADNHVPWIHYNTEFIDSELDLSSDNYEINQIRTTKDLLHISNPTVNDLKMKTYYLVVKDFIWKDTLPNTVSGIEVMVHVKRVGRIMDDTIQLCIGREGLGNNRADGVLSDIKTIGGPVDLWGIEEITHAQLNDPTFGLILRFQSNIAIPHRTTPNINHIQLRVW
jgi:hypothetical protein